MPPEGVISSTCEALEACHLPNWKWLNFEDGSLSLSCSTCSLSLFPPTWPNPEARRHRSISVTFDGPGLKQIYIPLVDFKRCMNNNASQRQANEACSGLAASDFQISLIRCGDNVTRLPPFTSSPLCAVAFFFVSVCPFPFSTPLLPSFPRSDFPESSHFSLSVPNLRSCFNPLFRYSCSPVSETWLN